MHQLINHLTPPHSPARYIVKDKYPYNHICLGVFTISFGVFMGSISTIFHGYWNFQVTFKQNVAHT